MTHVDDDLAVDGIDEVLDWFLAYQAEDVGPDGPGSGTVAVRTGDHIWRVHLLPDDVQLLAGPVLAHRLLLTADAALSRHSAEQVVTELLSTVPVPRGH